MRILYILSCPHRRSIKFRGFWNNKLFDDRYIYFNGECGYVSGNFLVSAPAEKMTFAYGEGLISNLLSIKAW
jgi:hypothetical protein